MKHPHHDLIVAWAADTSRVVQYRWAYKEWTDVQQFPDWDPEIEYRFKPEPKPDVSFELIVKQVNAYPEIRYPEHWEMTNIKFTFDGETGALKSAEVLK